MPRVSSVEVDTTFASSIGLEVWNEATNVDAFEGIASVDNDSTIDRNLGNIHNAKRAKGRTGQFAEVIKRAANQHFVINAKFMRNARCILTLIGNISLKRFAVIAAQLAT